VKNRNQQSSRPKFMTAHHKKTLRAISMLIGDSPSQLTSELRHRHPPSLRSYGGTGRSLTLAAMMMSEFHKPVNSDSRREQGWQTR
jgi:hypothetical protein